MSRTKNGQKNKRKRFLEQCRPLKGGGHGQKPRSWDQLGSGGTGWFSCQHTTEASVFSPLLVPPKNAVLLSYFALTAVTPLEELCALNPENLPRSLAAPSLPSQPGIRCAQWSLVTTFFVREGGGEVRCGWLTVTDGLLCNLSHSP